MYVEESFVLDCHALQARNDACALPLEDVSTSFILQLPECLSVICLCHHERELANQRGDPVINFF
ncbi:MAG: hypothetical protein K9G11_04025 [Rickettsiaceae bacterium]|nr:hypothetical protein [Rickettsiaceae bacterium]